VIGPDHQYYVSLLTGFPFIPGAANVYRVDPRTGAQTVFASGFTNLMDLAFGGDGTLYALSIDDNGLLAEGNEGAIYAVDRAGNSTKLTLPAGTLPMPGGITATNDALYVSINSGSPGNGQVIRIRRRPRARRRGRWRPPRSRGARARARTRPRRTAQSGRRPR
jgi:hypothetical protein